MQSGEVDDILNKVRVALEAGQVEDAIAALTSLHPVDRAEAFLDLEQASRKTLLQELDSQTTADLLEEMTEGDAAQVAAELQPSELADVLDEMSPEGAADILGDLPAAQAQSALAQMEDSSDVSPLLKYPDDSAGGIMSPDFIALGGEMSVDQVISHLREVSPRSESPYYLYVVGIQGELLGVVPLRELITSSPTRQMHSIMRGEIMSVRVDADQRELSAISKRYGLLLIPVVEHDGRLVGVVKSRDLVEVIEEEATDDLLRLGGVAASQPQVWSPLGRDIRRRLPWLYINLLTAFLAAWVVSLFESTIQRCAVLAVFQGVIAGQGGNAATQTLTLMVRGLALGEIDLGDTWKVLTREFLLGVVNGLAVGAAVGVGAYLWMGNGWLGAIVAVAMVGTIISAGIAGTVFPLLLRILKLDPALASGVLVTTVTDCVGFGFFLYLASISLSHLP